MNLTQGDGYAMLLYLVFRQICICRSRYHPSSVNVSYQQPNLSRKGRDEALHPCCQELKQGWETGVTSVIPAACADYRGTFLTGPRSSTAGSSGLQRFSASRVPNSIARLPAPFLGDQICVTYYFSNSTCSPNLQDLSDQ